MSLYKRGRYWYVDYYQDGKHIRKAISSEKRTDELQLAQIEIGNGGKNIGLITQGRKLSDFSSPFTQNTIIQMSRSNLERSPSLYGDFLLPWSSFWSFQI